MKILPIPQPVSGGILLSYKCNAECRHCMYACSPGWKGDWISKRDMEKILTQLSHKLRGKYPADSNRIGVNYGVHFTGGEPFLNFDVLLKITKKAHQLEIPSTFAETNCFWCTNDEATEDKLTQLKNVGLKGMLISANPFIVERVPFERTERGVEKSRKVFGKENVIVYQGLFYDQFKRLNIKGTLPFEEYLKLMYQKDVYSLHECLSFPSLIPMGRAPYKLGKMYKRHPGKHFFGESCREELTRPWHIHIDNYCNYMTGYCGGISLGDGRDIDSICQGINLDDYPIIETLATDVKKLCQFGVEEWGYQERNEGYISKCHLCVDIRKHIATKTDEFKELRPREFYNHLD